MKNATIAAAADVDEQRVRGFLQDFKIKRFYTDPIRMLDEVDLDAVVIAVPHGLHAKMTIEALKRDVNVLVEKPMATNTQSAMKMIDTARARKKVLMVGHAMRFQRQLQLGRELYVQGKLGKVYHASGCFLRTRGMPSNSTFLRKALANGGVLFDLGSHVLDCALFMLDFPTPVSALGRASAIFADRLDMRMNYPQPIGAFRGPSEVDDFAYGLVTFENGTRFYLETCWASYLKEDKLNLILLGDKGGINSDHETLHFMESRNGEFMTSTPYAGGELQPKTPQPTTYQGDMELFLRLVRNNDYKIPYPGCSGNQALLNVAIIESIYRSTKSGKEEKIEIPRAYLRVR